MDQIPTPLLEKEQSKPVEKSHRWYQFFNRYYETKAKSLLVKRTEAKSLRLRHRIKHPVLKEAFKYRVNDGD